MKTTFDFEPDLIRICQEIHPERVLEYGPGRSTRAIHETCPNAKIISIEHDEKWYKRAVERYGEYADVHLVPLEGMPSKYAVWPILNKCEPFDLVFIDGRRRVSCLVVAAFVTTGAGVIMLHDAERTAYKPGIDLLEQAGFIAEGTRTVILRRT
jgi:predicted O-methyltransferase YrrM